MSADYVSFLKMYATLAPVPKKFTQNLKS